MAVKVVHTGKAQQMVKIKLMAVRVGGIAEQAY
jgi:hypothetical protein